MAAAQTIASIVVPAYQSHETIRASLSSILAQRRQDFELIVVDSSADDRSARIVRESFPTVRYIRSTNRLLPHEARNRGAAVAAGQVLVFTDPDCIAEPDWLERLLAHHDAGCRIVGGSIGSLPGLWNRSVHFTKYPWWDPMSRGGLRPEIPSGNFSIARAVFETVQGFRGKYFAGDSEICWRARAAGHEIVFDPAAIVTHLDHARLGVFSRERLSRGRDFARIRLRTQQWSRRRCLAYLLAAPALPFVMTVRSGKYAVRGRYLLRWLPTAPIQFLGNCLWCGGEAVEHLKSIVDSR